MLLTLIPRALGWPPHASADQLSPDMAATSDTRNIHLQAPSEANTGYGGSEATGHGNVLLAHTPCLRSGERVVASNQAAWCIDIDGSEADGAKLVVDVHNSRPVDVVRLGDALVARAFLNQTKGAIIEVKRFQQSCEVCDLCECIGCGQQCGCSCNAQCRLGGGHCRGDQCRCSHTAGVLAPGRWYIGVDAMGSFTMQATLVTATALQMGILEQRTLHALGEGHVSFFATEGVATVDYIYIDTALHERLRLEIALVRMGSERAGVDIYLRYGAWPTTMVYDELLKADRVSPRVRFVLQPEQLFSDRLCLMVVGKGDSWVDYSISSSARPNTLLGALLLLALGVLMGVIFLLFRRTSPGAFSRPKEPVPQGVRPSMP